MSDQERICREHGPIGTIRYYGNDGAIDPGPCPWCRIRELEAERDRWKAEAMAARLMIGVRTDQDGLKYTIMLMVSHATEDRYLTSRAENEEG